MPERGGYGEALCHTLEPCRTPNASGRKNKYDQKIKS